MPADAVTETAGKSNRSQDSLRRLALNSIRESEDLRARVAQALHDDLGQTLTVLNLDLYWLSRNCPGEAVVQDKINEMQEAISDTSLAIRRLARDCRPLRPSASATLHDVIEWLVRQFEAQSRLSVEIRMPDLLPALRDEYTVALSRILLGSLRALARYGGPTAWLLTIDYNCERIMIELRNRNTMIAEPVSSGRRAPPLVDIREWLEAFGGSCDAMSVDDGDVEVTMTLPLPPELRSRI